MKKWERDPRTLVWYELHPEEWQDKLAASVGAIHLLSTLLFLAWLLFDIWIGDYSLLKAAGYNDFTRVNTPTFRLIAFVVIGGGLGGVVNGLQSFITWHTERAAYGRRFLWKDIILPPLGATLAVIVYALVQSGVAAFSGRATLGDGNAVSSLTALATGALAGYGSHKISIWLDLQVNRLFAASSGADDAGVIVPNLIGERREVSEKLLKEVNLSLGNVETQPHDDANKDKVDTIISQCPAGGSKVPIGVRVDVTIAKVSSATEATASSTGNRNESQKSNAAGPTVPTATPLPTSTSPPAASQK